MAFIISIEVHNVELLCRCHMLASTFVLVGVEGTLRYLQISVAWVYFGGKYTPDKGSKTIFGLLAFFINCPPKK